MGSGRGERSWEAAPSALAGAAALRYPARMALDLRAPAELADPTATLEALLRAAPEPAPVMSLDAWWIRHLRAAGPAPHPIDGTILAAARMDRLGYAVASAYASALSQLVPDVGPARVALAASEEGSAHPRTLRARLEPDGDGYRLWGDKQPVTLGAEADELLVVASEGVDAEGVNHLVLVDLPSRREGIRRELLAPLAFAPELCHARVRFEGVRVEAHERLDGDGYVAYLKPFRTLEDVHLHAAVLVHLLGVARAADWPRSVRQELLTLLVAARALAFGDPRSAALHLALAGEITRARLLIEETRDLWTSVSDEVRERWERDRLLLDVAKRARARRLEVAWRRADR